MRTKVLFIIFKILLETIDARHVVQRTNQKILPGLKKDTSPYLYQQNYNHNPYSSCCSDPTSSCCESSQTPTCCQILPGFVHVHEEKALPTVDTTNGLPSCCHLSTPPSCCHHMMLKLNETKAVPAHLPSDLTLHIKVVPGNATTTAVPPTTGYRSTIATSGIINRNVINQQALSEHNNRRSVHGAPPLKLNENLSNQAQAFAEKLAAEKKAYHSPQNQRPSVGENIAEKCTRDGTSLNGVSATDMWYSEVQNYNFQNPGYNEKTAHFSQVVWKGTKSAGFGLTQFKKGDQTCYIAVGRYQPRGNVKGQFPQNVLKGSHDQTVFG